MFQKSQDLDSFVISKHFFLIPIFLSANTSEFSSKGFLRKAVEPGSWGFVTETPGKLGFLINCSYNNLGPKGICTSLATLTVSTRLILVPKIK